MTEKKLKQKEFTAKKYNVSSKSKGGGGGKATIGNIGKTIVFEVNEEKILNFNRLTKTVKGRWASHPRVGKKPKKQFLGPDGASLAFAITLNAQHGVKPYKTLKRIEKAVKKGTPKKVVIGKKSLSNNRFVITEVSETYDRVLNKGELLKATCDITLEEYL